MHPRLEASGRESHRIGRRLVRAADAKAHRARARGVERERHGVTRAQARVRGELAGDEDGRKIRPSIRGHGGERGGRQERGDERDDGERDHRII